MARNEELMSEIEGLFADRIASISAMYFIKKYFYLFGVLIGMVAGFIFLEFAAFLIIGVIAAAVIYSYAESYLLKIDHEFFSSSGRSKQEIFNKYYAREVERRLLLRMTEPEQLVTDQQLTAEQTRAIFQQRLSAELDREFRKSDWRFFVAESLHYQKK